MSAIHHEVIGEPVKDCDPLQEEECMQHGVVETSKSRTTMGPTTCKRLTPSKTAELSEAMYKCTTTRLKTKASARPEVTQVDVQGVCANGKRNHRACSIEGKLGKTHSQSRK